MPWLYFCLGGVLFGTFWVGFAFIDGLGGCLLVLWVGMAFAGGESGLFMVVWF